jgi:hypothetical protein
MISNNYIGTMGRLGNQMFQYSSLRGIANKFNYDYCIPPENFENECPNSETNIFKVFDLPNAARKITDYIDLQENTFSHDENIWNNCPDNRNLKGFFQSEKYFIDIKEDIKKAFTFKDEVLNTANNIFNSIFYNEEVIAIHIRRGDYLYWTQFPIQPISYYEQALQLINNTDAKVLIFSDDIEWCKNQILFQNNRSFFAQYNSCSVDLCMMTFCNYHIISNSSFSWWGAWLSDSKMVISPKMWFSEPLVNDENFLMSNNSNWIKL